jgi:hypothetical protein
LNKELFGVQADQFCHTHVSAQDGTADKREPWGLQMPSRKSGREDTP